MREGTEGTSALHILHATEFINVQRIKMHYTLKMKV